METLFGLLVLLSLSLMLVGLISPQTSLFWAPQRATRWTSTLLYSAVAMGAFLLFGLLVEINDRREEPALPAPVSHRVEEEPISPNSSQRDISPPHARDWQ